MSAAEGRVTIVGGGIAALEAVLALRALAEPAEIELIAPSPEADYRPLSVLLPFAFGEMPVLGLASFAEEHRARHRRDTLVAVDSERRLLTTGRGESLAYELLVVASGARQVTGVAGAQPFRGPLDQREVGLLVEEYAQGDLGRLAFAVPAGDVWPLPIYDLALMAATTLAGRERRVEISVVTPEPRPLSLFGDRASDAVERLLRAARIRVQAGVEPERFDRGVLTTASGAEIETDRVVALPRLRGPGFKGLPADSEGFVPTDRHGLVEGLADVYAAGDVTTFPIKQGGIATQQADAVAEAIAARLGANVEPKPFEPVLRGLLLTGMSAQYLEREAPDRAGTGGPLRPAVWSPSSKVFGRYLLPYLGGRTAEELVKRDARAEGAIAVEAEL